MQTEHVQFDKLQCAYRYSSKPPALPSKRAVADASMVKRDGAALLQWAARLTCLLTSVKAEWHVTGVATAAFETVDKVLALLSSPQVCVNIVNNSQQR
jgi:hypothetical protein